MVRNRRRALKSLATRSKRQAAHVSADPLRNAAALIPESAHSTEKSSDYDLEEQEGPEAAMLQIRPLLIEPLLLEQLADPNTPSEEIILHSILLRRRSEWTESDSAYIQKCLCSGTLEGMLAKWLCISGTAQERAAP